jgi:HK97 gp10 family phage protein
MSQVRVKGLAELNKFLQELPVKMEANIMRGALRAGLKPIKEDAVQNCPVGDPNEENRVKYGGYRGALRDSIRVSARIDKKNGKVVARLVVGGKGKNGADVWYAHLIELTGASAHSLSRKKGGELNHPGFRPKPFMRPALDAQANNAVLAAGQYIKKRLATKNGINTADIELGIE